MRKKVSVEGGFTLLEILLVVAAIAILAGIVILAINPSKQLGDTRNAQRRVDVNTIMNAIYQYSLDNNGELPANISQGTCSTSAYEICKTGESCSGLVDLGVLTSGEEYLVSLPVDPTATTTTGTGYHVIRSSTDRVTVCAPLAEESETISVSR